MEGDYICLPRVTAKTEHIMGTGFNGGRFEWEMVSSK